MKRSEGMVLELAVMNQTFSSLISDANILQCTSGDLQGRYPCAPTTLTHYRDILDVLRCTTSRVVHPHVTQIIRLHVGQVSHTK